MMKRCCIIGVGICLLLSGFAEEIPLRPAGKEWPPVIGAWFWKDEQLETYGYKPFLDAAAAESPYTLLTTSLRISKGEIVDPHVRAQIGRAVNYAEKLGLRIAFDLDIRLARRAFRARYPSEQQEELVLKTVVCPSSGKLTVEFSGRDLSDHMTGGTFPYTCLTTRLVRCYSFVGDEDGFNPATLKQLSTEHVSAVSEGPCKLIVKLAAEPGCSVCVVAAHAYLTPDVFAPHLLAFQREIMRQYADLPLVGVMKDEWGFPPDHSGNPKHDRYWYSMPMAEAYAACSNGRDLIRDALLMNLGCKGGEVERQSAINRYRKLCRDRNVVIEDDFYNAGKEYFGKDAAIVTHATWTPYPGAQEFRKHGLDWWEATRDIGQCDESTPYPCRTSLAKRWGYPLWYNQYYSPKADAYARELWAGALGGGRLNFHPLYPLKDVSIYERHCTLMRQPFMRGLMRLRMLDFITKAPVNSPVAVVFGHACAMNWTSPSYNRVGLDIASVLCSQGYPTDLIPSSLIGSSALRIDEKGFVALGQQQYRAVVLFEPEFGSADDLDFFKLAAKGKSKIFQVGGWSCDAEAHPLAAVSELSSSVNACAESKVCLEQVMQFLEKTGVARVTGWTSGTKKWGQVGGGRCSSPPMTGFTVLTDGTCVQIAGSNDPEGDSIQKTFSCQGHPVTVDAVGVVAIRLSADGQILAFAAGGLKSIQIEGFDLSLTERLDLAFERGTDGRLHGVVQGLKGALPKALLAITTDWERLRVE